MTGLEPLLAGSPYRLARGEKDALLTRELLALTERHRRGCPPYAAMLDGLGFKAAGVSHYRELPFLPVGLFKSMRLASVPDADIIRTVTSSGTSGQAVSRILLDAETASLQQTALACVVGDFLGPRRLPMLIIDCPSVLKDRKAFTARGAGILGFSLFGSKRRFALDDDMRLDQAALSAFLEETAGRPFFAFGFTYIIWRHFYRALAERGGGFDLSGGVLIHGGGWKAMAAEAVSPAEFNRRLKAICGLRRVHDYYGMAEQTGSIFMQCEAGHFHCSDLSGVIVRRAVDFSPCEVGEPGILQALSLLPRSYPGHSLLTEDEGTLLGTDDCPCGRGGDYFSVAGRLKHAELRGCSDTYAIGM